MAHNSFTFDCNSFAESVAFLKWLHGNIGVIEDVKDVAVTFEGVSYYISQPVLSELFEKCNKTSVVVSVTLSITALLLLIVVILCVPHFRFKIKRAKQNFNVPPETSDQPCQI